MKSASTAFLGAKSPDPAEDAPWHLHCNVWLLTMTSTTSRSVLICGMFATALLAGGRAQGQTGALAATDFTILFKGYFNGQWVQMNSTQQQYYFNQARCLCDTYPNGEFEVVVQPGSGAGQKILTQLESNSVGGQGASYLFASTMGYDCLNPAAYIGGLGAACTNLVAPSSGYPGTIFSSMAAFGMVPFVTSGPIPVAYLFNALSNPTCGSNGTCDSAALCRTTTTQTNIQIWAQTNSGIGPDFDPGPAAAVNLVGNVPVTPTNVAADGGNEGLEVSWNWGGVDIATDTTLVGVQIFCQRGADAQVFQIGSYAPAYMTPAMLCPNSPAAAAATTTGGPFSNFDPKYLCSGLIPATTTSYRITGLQNGIPYGVGVAAVDKYGNIGASSDIVYAMPGASTGGTGGTSGAGGAGGYVGGPDAEATGGALGSGGAAGDSPPDGAAGFADAGTKVRLGNGCSCDIRGKHGRNGTSGTLWLALVTLAFALRFHRWSAPESRVAPIAGRSHEQKVPITDRLSHSL